MVERVSIVYDGNIATSGQLHFYEYGRAAYAFSRFISTIESFRRNNEVPRRITGKHYVDLIIEAHKPGSFPIDVVIPTAAGIAGQLSQVPLDIFVQYVVSQVQRIFPQEEDALLQAAKYHLELEKQKTEQSKEETKRFRALERMIKQENVQVATALDIVRAGQEQQSLVTDALLDSNRSVNFLAEKLKLMKQREDAFAEHAEDLEKISSDKMVKLASKVRPQIAEIGLPLRKSASVLALTSGKARKTIARFDEEEIDDINSRALDEESTSIEARFTAYDRDTGIGKLDLPTENLRRVTFNIPPGERSKLRPKILRAMDEDAVVANLKFFKDQSGALTSAIVEDIFFETAG